MPLMMYTFNHNQLKQEATFLLSKEKKILDIFVCPRFLKHARQIQVEFQHLKRYASSTTALGWYLLNKTLERLNTHLAHLQTISFTDEPLTKLHLSFLTRLTPGYIELNHKALQSVKALYINARGTKTSHTDLDNKLFSLPHNIGSLQSLEVLYARYNALSTLPDEIGYLPHLKELGLEGNRLTQLPGTIGDISTLEELGLDKNRLTSLPDSLGNLSRLKILSLDDNWLFALPPSLTKLTSLNILGANNNFLTALPTLTPLKSLRVLGVKKNLLDKETFSSPRCLRMSY